jgi:hypothetical protein
MPDIKGECIIDIRANGDNAVYTFTWISDAIGNVLHTMNAPIIGVPKQLSTRPVDTPTDDYDVTILDESGRDVLLGKGVNRDQSTSETVFIYESSNTDVYNATRGLHRFKVAGAGNTKSGVAILTIDRIAELRTVTLNQLPSGPSDDGPSSGGVPIPRDQQDADIGQDDGDLNINPGGGQDGRI